MKYPDTETLIFRIALSRLKGMSVELARHIESVFGSLSEFFNVDDRALASVTGISSRMFGREVRDSAMESAAVEARWIADNGVQALYFTDDDYPKRLADCCDAPIVLYSFGRVNLNPSHVLSVVGTRHATVYGQQFVHQLISDLSQKIPDLLIVSGLAYGIDVCAHRESLACTVPTVGVLAHGLSTIYPSVHRQIASDMISAGGGLVTDYVHDAAIHRGNFLARNRIVAGLCDALLVVESASKGGALVTAAIASEYGRDVFAVPGRATDPFSEGCNRLIYRNIAGMITSADDIIEATGWTPVETEGEQKSLFVELSSDQQKIIEYLIRNGSMMINRMSVELNIPIAKLIQLLGDMEFNGLVMSVPGGRYAATGNLNY